MALYPLLISFFFLLPVLIGIWAHGAGVNVANPDNVLLVMVENYSPSFVFSFVIVGALAALMSTADSQLLSLSTMLTCDTMGKKVRYSKIVTVLLTSFAIIFITFGYNPRTGIMGTLVSTTFSGLVVLFPSVIATLYWKKATKWGCMASIIGGEFKEETYGDFQREMDLRTGCKQNDVRHARAVGQNVRPLGQPFDHGMGVRALVHVQDRDFLTRQDERRRPRPGDRHTPGGGRFVSIRRPQDGHVRDGPQGCDLLHRLVRRAVFPHGDAVM
jgi:hypothetical protein